jgi:hypothetical protein
MPIKEPMDTDQECLRTDGKSQHRFCALEYRPQSRSGLALQSGPVILLALSDAEGNSCFLVDPEFRTMVRDEDQAYIVSLLQDLPERVKQDPAALFKQLSSLGVGPLVAQAAGVDLKDHPELQERCSTFVRL